MSLLRITLGGAAAPPNLPEFSDYLTFLIHNLFGKNDIPGKRGDVADDLLQHPFFDGFYSNFYEIIVYYKTGFIECGKSIDNTFRLCYAFINRNYDVFREIRRIISQILQANLNLLQVLCI